MTTANPSLLCEPTNQLGIISLNSPQSLNSLTLEMCQNMAQTLQQWRQDDRIQCVLIKSTLSKALCAGGDVVSLYQSLQSQSDYHTQFFHQEYHLDQMIHHYPKPIVVFATGIVMGGGIGIMNGASHRVVTETTKMAMPEITIGFFPDVGGGYFLNRMPGKIGLFLALTGARFNGTDACQVNIADYLIPSSSLEALQTALSQREFTTDTHSSVSALIERFKQPHFTPPSPQLIPRMETINDLLSGQSIAEVKAKLESFHTHDPWLKRAITTFSLGSPTSMAVIFEQLQRARPMTIDEVFAMESILSYHFGQQHDFAEGVRALLIAKDHRPVWQPANLAAVSPERVAQFFAPTPLD